MANIIPPAPSDFNPDNQYQWVEFYRRVREAINTAANVTWANLDFSGSNITSIVTRRHRDLQDLQGGAAGDYQHLTTTQLNSLSGIGSLVLNSKASDPVAADITAGTAKLYKNTSTSAVKLWVNDGGTLKSVTLV